MNTQKLNDKLVEYNIATEEEISLVCNINGFNDETMYDILYARTALQNFDDIE